MIGLSISGPTAADVSVVVDRMTRSLTKLDRQLEAAADIVRQYTAARFESRGFGEWPPLAESTIQAKAAANAPDPERELYNTGQLMEAITAPGGVGGAAEPDAPQGFQMVNSNPGGVSSVTFGVDWDVGGWQVPVLLDAGADPYLPARPIWPTGAQEAEMRLKIAEKLRGWLSSEVTAAA